MSIPSKSKSRSGLGGFTLVEVLVAVSLLSIIMVALGSAMRTMAQTESRVDQRLQRMDDLRVASGFLQQVLGRIPARTTLAPSGDAPAIIPFRANAHSIEWVGIMPARHGLGGRFFFRLQPEDTSAGQSLVLRFAPWDAAAKNFPEWSQTELRTLAGGLTGFEVLAEGRPAGTQPPGPQWPVGWTSGWPVQDQLPQRLRLKITLSSGPWPDLVVPVLALKQGSASSGGFAIGGTR